MDRGTERKLQLALVASLLLLVLLLGLALLAPAQAKAFLGIEDSSGSDSSSSPAGPGLQLGGGDSGQGKSVVVEIPAADSGVDGAGASGPDGTGADGERVAVVVDPAAKAAGVAPDYSLGGADNLGSDWPGLLAVAVGSGKYDLVGKGDSVGGSLESSPVVVMLPWTREEYAAASSRLGWALQPLTDASFDASSAQIIGELASALMRRHYADGSGGSGDSTDGGLLSSRLDGTGSSDGSGLSESDFSALRAFSEAALAASRLGAVDPSLSSRGFAVLAALASEQRSEADDAAIHESLASAFNSFNSLAGKLSKADALSTFGALTHVLSDSASSWSDRLQRAGRLIQSESARLAGDSGASGSSGGASGDGAPGGAATGTSSGPKFYDLDAFPSASHYFVELGVSEYQPVVETEIMLYGKVPLSRPLTRFVANPTEKYKLSDYATVTRVTKEGDNYRLRIRVDISPAPLSTSKSQYDATTDSVKSAGVFGGNVPFDEVNGDLVLGFFEIPAAISEDSPDYAKRLESLPSDSPERVPGSAVNRIRFKIRVSHIDMFCSGIMCKIGFTSGDKPPDVTLGNALQYIMNRNACDPDYLNYDASLAADLNDFLCPLDSRQPIAKPFSTMFTASDQHQGIDLNAPVGTPVYAALPGSVVRSGSISDSCGTGVRIVHGRTPTGANLETAYCGLSEPDVQPGSRVKRGQLIGRVGAPIEGAVAPGGSKNWLHFMVFEDGVPVDPAKLYSRCKLRSTVIASTPVTAGAGLPSGTGYGEALNAAADCSECLLLLPSADPLGDSTAPVIDDSYFYRNGDFSNGCVEKSFFSPRQVDLLTKFPDLRGKPSISVTSIQRNLDAANSPAASERGFAKCLFDEGVKAGIDPVFALAFFRAGSSFGRTTAGLATKGFGVLRYDGPRSGVIGAVDGLRSFSSYCDAARDWYDEMKNGKNFFKATPPRYTLDEIAAVYAPPSKDWLPDYFLFSVRSNVARLRAQELQLQDAFSGDKADTARFGTTIVLDAGYGVGHPAAGEKAVVDGRQVSSSEIVLDVANRAKAILEGRGFSVIMTRTGEKSPAEGRDSLIYRARKKDYSSFFISIHTTPAGGSGPHVYYWGTTTENGLTPWSKQLSENIANHLEANGFPAPPVEVSPLNYYAWAGQPRASPWVELGSLTDPEDAKRLASDEGRQDAAEAIALGFIAYYRSQVTGDAYDYTGMRPAGS